MIVKKPIYYMVPVLLALLIFSTNFLATEIFKVDIQNFTVWFVLSLFSFACGWLINKTMGWTHGGKVVFSVIVTAVFISIIMVSLFNNYFGVNHLLTENLILYTLRNIMLGAMAFFGMAIAEILILQKTIISGNNNSFEEKKTDEEAKRRAQLMLEEAKLVSEKMTFEAEKQARVLEENKNRIEAQLKELIQVEKELIKKYEEEDKNN